MTIENQLFEDISPIIKMVMLQLAMLLFVGYMIFRTIQLRCEFCWFKNSYPFAGEMRQLTQIIFGLRISFTLVWPDFLYRNDNILHK